MKGEAEREGHSRGEAAAQASSSEKGRTRPDLTWAGQGEGTSAAHTERPSSEAERTMSKKASVIASGGKRAGWSTVTEKADKTEPVTTTAHLVHRTRRSADDRKSDTGYPGGRGSREDEGSGYPAMGNGKGGTHPHWGGRPVDGGSVSPMIPTDWVPDGTGTVCLRLPKIMVSHVIYPHRIYVFYKKYSGEEYSAWRVFKGI